MYSVAYGVAAGNNLSSSLHMQPLDYKSTSRLDRALVLHVVETGNS